MTHPPKIAQEVQASRAKPAVFLDRDGTINVDVGYLSSIERWAFTPGAPAALRRLKRAGFLLLVVTNQSGLARGLFSQLQLDRIHQHAQALLEAEGAGVDGFYVSPYHPEYGRPRYDGWADTRKPELGLFTAACRDHVIDVASSWMVGDKPSDVEFALRAGLSPLFIGRSPPSIAPNVTTFADLLSAAAFILRRRPPWSLPGS